MYLHPTERDKNNLLTDEKKRPRLRCYFLGHAAFTLKYDLTLMFYFLLNLKFNVMLLLEELDELRNWLTIKRPRLRIKLRREDAS